MITVSVETNVIDVSPRFEVDEYVPITFRTYSGLLGAKYLRIGNFETTLLELLLDPHSYTIRGVTLLSFDKTHVPHKSFELPETIGLPVLDAQGSGLIDFSDKQHAEIGCKFSVGLVSDFFEIDLFGISSADSAIRCDRTYFLLRGKSLVGIRFTKLNSQETSLLENHISSVGKS